MEKTVIKNRNDQKIVVVVDDIPDATGLAFVMHGLGGFKEQPHVQSIAETFQKNGYTTVRFDTTNTIGESEGAYEHATVTSYYEDLEDVISWAATQEWYKEPFCLAGHSLGAMAVTLYTERFPEKVNALAPIGVVVSGALSLETHTKEELDKWKQTGWSERVSRSKPGVILRLPWSHIEDRLKYNLLDNIDKLTMPVLLIVGDGDKRTPLKHQQLIYEQLPGKKDLHIVKGAEHMFRKEHLLRELKHLFEDWIKNI